MILSKLLKMLQELAIASRSNVRYIGMCLRAQYPPSWE